MGNLIRQINNEYRDFYTIYRRNFPFLHKICTYCTGFTKDDIYEISLYVFFAHNFQGIVNNKVLNTKEIDNMFLQMFRREVVKDNSYTYDIRTNNDLHRVIDKFNNLAVEEIDNTQIEEDIVNSVVYKEFLTILSEDELEFCMTYVKYGYRYTAKIYGIGYSAVRKRFQRYIEKARKNIKGEWLNDN